MLDKFQDTQKQRKYRVIFLYIRNLKFTIKESQVKLEKMMNIILVHSERKKRRYNYHAHYNTYLFVSARSCCVPR